MRPARTRTLTILVYHPADAAQYAALIRPGRGRVKILHAATPEDARPIVAGVDVVYAWGFPSSLYPLAARLAWLQIMGAGVDAALVPELPPHVTVTRAPGVFGPWMAEYAIGWMLWSTQRMSAYAAAQREQRWLGDVLPERLGGKTLAIIGLGDIGRTVARAAAALGMRVVGVSRAARKVAGVERVWTGRGLHRAVAQADFVLLTVPLTNETRGLVGAAALGAMPRHAWLLNVARGAVVDEAALVHALRERRIAGAVLDVFAEEPLPRDHDLWRLPNVVITPHIAGPSTPAEIAPIFNENLRRFLERRPLRHVVDRQRGY